MNNNSSSPTDAPPSGELFIKTIQLFGAAEAVQLDDARFSAVFKNSLADLQTSGPANFLAVPLAADSNLCAIVAPYESLKLFTPFMEQNVNLFRTMWTTWRNTIFVWVRIEGWKPASCALPGLLWMTDGLLPAVDFNEKLCPDGFPHKTYGQSILTIRFESIKWSPAVDEVFLLERMEFFYGKLVLATGPRQRKFNASTVAQFLAVALGITFDVNTNQFFMASEQKTEVLPKFKLNNMIAVYLSKTASKYPFRIAALQPSVVVTLLKTICAVERPDEYSGLMLYLKNRLERRPGTNVTTAEIMMDYNTVAKAVGLRVYPECVFKDKLAPAIREQFGLTKSHNIMRPNVALGRSTAKYGFNGLGFKASGATEAAEPKEVQEQPEGSDSQTAPDDLTKTCRN